MTSKWDRYVVQDGAAPSKWDQYVTKEEPTLKERAKEVPVEAVKGLGRLTARGAASLLAAPSKGIGGLLTLISKLGEEGRPGTQMLQSAGQYFTGLGEQGQAQLKGGIEKLMGTSYGSGEEALTKFTERVADIYGRLPLKGMAVPSILGGAGGQVAEEMGAPPEVQMLAELAGMTTQDIGRGLSSLIKKPIGVKAIAPAKEAIGVTLPKIAEKERKISKVLKPTVLPGAVAKAERKLLQEGEEALQAIKRTKLPIAQQIEEGKPVEEITNKMFKKISSDAETLPGPINTDNMIKAIESKLIKYKKARTPSTTEAQAIKSGESLIKDLRAGDMSMKELVAQYRSNNKTSKSLIEKTLTEGKQPESLEVYQSFNDAIAKEIEKHPEATTLFKRLFKTSNANFTQLRKIDQYESIIKSAVDANGVFSPKKFSRVFKDPGKVRRLNKIVGIDGVNNLKKVSGDLVNAQDALSKIDPLKMKDVFLGSPLLLKYLGIPGGKAVTAAVTLKRGADVAYGYYLMRPQSRVLLNKVTKSIKANKFDQARKAALALETGFKERQKETD